MRSDTFLRAVGGIDADLVLEADTPFVRHASSPWRTIRAAGVCAACLALCVAVVTLWPILPHPSTDSADREGTVAAVDTNGVDAQPGESLDRPEETTPTDAALSAVLHEYLRNAGADISCVSVEYDKAEALWTITLDGEPDETLIRGLTSAALSAIAPGEKIQIRTPDEEFGPYGGANREETK